MCKVFNINKLLLSEKRTNYFTKKSSYYLLTDDFLILYKKLNKKIFKELKDIYFTSEDMQIRSSIIEGLLHSDNKHFVNEDFRKYLSFCKGYFPISMSRLYILRKLDYEQSNVLATNIYDITKDPIDSYTYLKTALENSFPIIFQASLNSIGQREKSINGSHKEGYLKPKKGGLCKYAFSLFKHSTTISQMDCVKSLTPFFGFRYPSLWDPLIDL